MTARGNAGGVTTYTDYFSYGGYQFQITAIRIHDPTMRDANEGEWNVSVDCPEQPAFTFQFEPSDLGDADTPEEVIGRVRDAISSYVDQHPDLRPTEVP